MDLGARTGNTAAIPGLIHSTQQTGMANQSNNALNLMIQNAMQKQTQQQSAAGQLAGLFGTDTKASNDAFSGANDALGTKLKADEAAQQASMSGIQSMGGLLQSGGDALSSVLPGAAGQAAGAIGTLGSFFV
jgi:phosphoribosylaminoimidazole (AIR) synthetase